MPTRRQSIVAAMLARVQTITEANGSETNVGETVFLGEKGQLGPADPPQAVAIIVGDEEIGKQLPGKAFLIWLPFSIRALAQGDDPIAPWLMVEAIVGDIKRAIEGDPTLGGLLDSELVRGNVVTLDREPGSKTVGVACVYRVPYKETWAAP